MSHNHSCKCEHENVKYCSHCRVVYCQDCKQEWRSYPNYGYWYYDTNTWPNKYWNDWIVYCNGSKAQNYQPSLGIPEGSDPQLTTTNSCSHHG